MKRQFVQIQPFQNKDEHLVQQHQQGQGGLLSRSEWSPTTDAQPGVTSGTDPNSLPATYTPGMGLLSGWKAMRGVSQSNTVVIDGFNGTRDASLIAGGMTQQPAAKGPVTGPAIMPEAAQSQVFARPLLPAQGAPNIPAGVGMGAMPVRGANAPVAPVAPGPQQINPLVLPVVAPRSAAWPQGWAGSPQGAAIGFSPSPAQAGYPSAYARPGYQPPPGYYVPPAHVEKRKKRRVPIWARVILIFVLVILLMGGAGAYYYETNFAASVADITNQQVPRLKGDVDPNQTTANGGDILSGGRINILLLGSDTDQKFDGVYLAQTDIVVTIDPQTKYVGMLSIPRDTWLQAADGYGFMKLDQAYGRGGIALSRATIYQDFGIPINYYAWVGLDGFIKVVNTVNGVDIDAIHPITDDNYPDDVGGSQNQYAYMRLYIAPGPQHMNGETALEYVRSRHADLVGDFGRSQRQQQLLSALKLKLNNPNVVGELPQLANDLNGYVKTDMQLTDVFKLMNFARSINQSQIKQLVLDGDYSRTVGNYPTAYGAQDIVVLNCATVQPAIAQMFGLGDQARCPIDPGLSSTGVPNSTSTAIATVQQPSSSAVPSFATPVSSDSVWQVAQQMTEVSSMSYSDGSSSLLGVRSLIDLLCLTVFESPIGMQA
ncbi:MAG TPA: LCP family protein [Ktedonobacteraceae bacterium]|nr:LCP family protein [Ktedonobacteraceae bacterium]